MPPTRDVGGHSGLTCERAAEEVIAANHDMQKPKEAARRNGAHTGDAAEPPEVDASSLKGVSSPRLRHFLTMAVEPTRVLKCTSRVTTGTRVLVVS